MKNTKIISGFPAVGKSFIFKNSNKLVLDSDSSEFSWLKDSDGNNTKVRNSEFPKNYIKHIKNNIGKVDIIMVSSHDVVREALKDNKIPYTIVYPNISLKDEYIERFIKRGNKTGFIDFISAYWDSFINEISNETYPTKIILEKGQYLSDVIEKII